MNEGKVNKITKLKGKCPYCGSSNQIYDIFDYLHCNDCGHFFNPDELERNNLDKWIKKGGLN